MTWMIWGVPCLQKPPVIPGFCQASGAYCNLRYARVVPWLICTLDVVSAVGAGMTVKFFPLFFKEDYGLNPGTSTWLWMDGR